MCAGSCMVYLFRGLILCSQNRVYCIGAKGLHQIHSNARLRCIDIHHLWMHQSTFRPVCCHRPAFLHAIRSICGIWPRNHYVHCARITTKPCSRMLPLCPCTLYLQYLVAVYPLTGQEPHVADRFPSVYRVQAYWLYPAMHCNVSLYGNLRSRFVKNS